MKIIFRDDDVSVETDMKRFKEIHALFTKYDVTHTIALICKGLTKNSELTKFVKKQKNIDVQIHAWEHYDMTKEPRRLIEDLPKCISLITDLFGKHPTTVYPPWNKTSPDVEHIAWMSDLKVSNKKISISQYLAGKTSEVINLHYWADECDQLEEALIKYNK